jgi:hypothetical protein
LAEKRIRNKTTGKYYKIRERNSKYGQKGEIMGLWHNDGDHPVKKKRLPPRDKEGRFREDGRGAKKEKKGFFRRLFGL